MSRLLFIIDAFGGDGPTRSLIALAEAVSANESSTALHVATLSDAAYPFTLMQGRRAGLTVHLAVNADELAELISDSDVVVPIYWNSPTMTAFMAAAWPPMRLAPWLQINGSHAPQTLSSSLIAASATMICTATSTMQLPELEKARVAHVPAFPNLGRLTSRRPGDQDPFTVTYLGTINGAKMHTEFVAMSSAIEVPGVRILIHGTGGGEALLAEQILASPDPARFELGGFVENIGAVLEQTHVFGYPLKRETYATTEKSLIEAMAAGVCPVVFAHGGVSEIVIDGETGLIVADEVAYAEAIRWLHDHPRDRERMATAAQAAIRSQFEPQRLAKRFLEVMHDVATRPRVSWPADQGDRTAADRFVDSLGRGGEIFARSRHADVATAAGADRAIASRHDHLGYSEGGIVQYRNANLDDPWLRYWTGLVLFGAGRLSDAETEFSSAAALDPALQGRWDSG